jgi:alpha-tubulin suppressor-like RCC1 family protein
MATGYKFPIRNYDDTIGSGPELITRVITTVTQGTFTVPSDFGSLAYVGAIGGGGGARVTSSIEDAAGGGGGAYAQTTGLSLTPNQTIYYRVGAGGTGGAPASAGVSSWINISANSAPTSTAQGCLAAAGNQGALIAPFGFSAAGGDGGSVASSIGTLEYAGGNGGDAATGANGGGSGGGGAAGPNGAGGIGGQGGDNSNMGGGGGGSNGGSAGTNAIASPATPGTGGNGLGGIGGGAAANTSVAAGSGTAGTGGGGGGGHTNSTAVAPGGNGGTGSVWTFEGLSYGPGGGGGGGGDATGTVGRGGTGGLYGGGGGGGEVTGGSAGAQGLVVFAYYNTGIGLTTRVDMEDMFVRQDYFLDSNLLSWGLATSGQIGDGTTISKSSPVQIGTLTNWKYISSSGSTAHAIRTDGSLWAWGLSSAGRLGDGTILNKSTPIQVGTSTDWYYIAKSGGGQILAIKTNGTLWSWGENARFGLGDGTNVDKSTPSQIGTSTDWKHVTTGGGGGTTVNGLAIKTNGTLWGWGENQFGNLGDGTTIAKSTPIQIGTSNDWRYVVTGIGTLAIKTNGTLWAWGNNTSGVLGTGTTINYSSPVQVGILTNWKYVSTRTRNCAAIKDDGTLWTWGHNSSGELGDRTTINKSSPIQIGGLTNWKHVDVGGSLTGGGLIAAVKTDGTLWTCGNNFSGELGDGTTINKSSPIQIGSLTNWKQIACGLQHVNAISSPDLP